MNKLKNIRKQNKGTTMMEVIVAFVVLLILLALLQQVINFAGNMMMTTSDKKDSTKHMQEGMYNDSEVKIPSETLSENITFVETDDQGNVKSGGATFAFKKAVLKQYSSKANDEESVGYIIEEK